MKPRVLSNMKDLSVTSNFTRIYTPQNYMRREKHLHKRLKKNTSKTKTMIESDLDFKPSVEPINISTNKESNITINSGSSKLKHKFRVHSAHPNYFNRLKSAHKQLKSNDMNLSKFTSLSAKDWKIFSVRETDQSHTENKPLRNCCSAKKTKDRLYMMNHARRLFKQRQDVYLNARHIDETLVESSKADMMIPHQGKLSS